MIDIGSKVVFNTLRGNKDFSRSGVVKEYKQTKRGIWVVILADDGKEYTTREALVKIA